MKKLMYKLNFAIVGIMASVPAFAVESEDICKLVGELQGVFKIMRTLAFVGAGFLIAKWAWGYIEGGKVDAKGVQALAAMPSKEQLIAKMLGSMQAPLTNFVGVLTAMPRGLVVALNAIAEQKAQ